MDDGIFSGDVAKTYDADLAEHFTPEVIDPTVDFLAGLAGDGRVLEFASGTGRIALPLAGHGLDVVGIELSRDMVAEMEAKPGADRVPVTVGDMATTRVEGEFSLVVLIFNTITNLLTQDEQVACFENAAAHLAPGGHFVIEVGIPPLRKLPMGETMHAFDVSDGHVGVETIDVANQRTISHHYWVSDGVGHTLDSHHRYAWPAEYDLMARLAGLTLTERAADWDRSPFTAESAKHISVWRK